MFFVDELLLKMLSSNIFTQMSYANCTVFVNLVMMKKVDLYNAIINCDAVVVKTIMTKLGGCVEQSRDAGFGAIYFHNCSPAPQG
jgi:hypothetical protein